MKLFAVRLRREHLENKDDVLKDDVFMEKKEAEQILSKLKANYPSARTALKFNSPFELLIATILSAQCTDIRVNEITKELFELANTPQDILKLGRPRLIQIIKGAGLYKNKSKNILETCEILVDEYEGEVPAKREELEKLPGVGRKTANVVLANAFNIPAFAVDTHVLRVSKRLGLTDKEDPRGVEQDLMSVFDRDDWNVGHHLLIYHGRAVCKARKPQCENCSIIEHCKYYHDNYQYPNSTGR